MSYVIDGIFADVCLDERISDGIFRMDNAKHMDALREYLIKKGIPLYESIKITNQMVEGKYPDRQAYRAEDGICVTWPSAQHKAKALQKPENRGKYVEANPFPKKATKQAPSTNANVSTPNSGVPDSPTEPKQDLDTEFPEKKPVSDLFSKKPEQSPTQNPQQKQQLKVEPPEGENEPSTLQSQPQQKQQVRTPSQLNAEKEIVKQIMKTDDTVLTNFTGPISEVCHKQLNELYKKANEMGLKEAVTFLTPFIKS